MWSQMVHIQEAVLCVLMNLSDTDLKKSIENDVADLRDRVEK